MIVTEETLQTGEMAETEEVVGMTAEVAVVVATKEVMAAVEVIAKDVAVVTVAIAATDFQRTKKRLKRYSTSN